MGIDDISFRIDFLDPVHIQHTLVLKTLEQPIEVVFRIVIKFRRGYA